MKSKVEISLGELVTAYRDLTQCYQQVASFSDLETQLITNGDMENLLSVLQKKEAIIVEVAAYDTKIRSLQSLIASEYQLEEFSLKQLFDLIPAANHYILLKLQVEIKKLIKQLEILEEQEKKHEELLRDYANTTKNVPQELKYNETSSATKAYAKIKKSVTYDSNNIDLKK